MNKILEEGSQKEDRTGTGTISLFGQNLEFDLKKGFPLVTTKEVHFKSIAHELLWIIKGDTNIKYLNDNDVHIWDEWADEDGDLGPTYGKQWRNVEVEGFDTYECFDQLETLILHIKTNHNSRRLIVDSWNVEHLGDMQLPPCHMMFQCYVDNGKLSLKMYQRSADVFLGLPFNIASYALLLEMLAQVTGLKADMLYISLGDAHIYNNHIEQCKTQLNREPMELSNLELNDKIKNIDDFKYEDIKLFGYQHHPKLKGDVSV